jgi:hypothetical protein
MVGRLCVTQTGAPFRRAGPTIHVFFSAARLGTAKEVVDGRDKRDHDGLWDLDGSVN